MRQFGIEAVGIAAGLGMMAACSTPETQLPLDHNTQTLLNQVSVVCVKAAIAEGATISVTPTSIAEQHRIVVTNRAAEYAWVVNNPVDKTDQAVKEVVESGDAKIVYWGHGDDRGSTATVIRDANGAATGLKVNHNRQGFDPLVSVVAMCPPASLKK